jgi:hypothetical protein
MLANDLDQLKAVGHGALTIVNGAILLAIVAVLLATQSQTASMIATFLQFVTWLVAQVVSPVTGGTSVQLTNQLAPAGGYGVTGGGTSGGTSTPAGSQWSIPSQWGTTGPAGLASGGTAGAFDWITGGNPDTGLGGTGSVSGTPVVGSTLTQFGTNPATGAAQLYIVHS